MCNHLCGINLQNDFLYNTNRLKKGNAALIHIKTIFSEYPNISYTNWNANESEKIFAVHKTEKE